MVKNIMTVFCIDSLNYLIYSSNGIFIQNDSVSGIAQGKDDVANLVDIPSQQVPIDSYLNQICNIF